MRRLETSEMPKEIYDAEEFIALAEDATMCTVKKNEGKTKIKLRTSRYLYTIVLDHDEASNILGKIQCPTEEI
jgi:large subunit ribosomal protein L38e